MTVLSQFSIQGNIIDATSNKSLKGVTISISPTEVQCLTNNKGEFKYVGLANDIYQLKISFQDYETQHLTIELNNKDINLNNIYLFKSTTLESQTDGFVLLSNDELSDDTDNSDNLTGVLQASKDIFSNVAAFEWSSCFFRPRGLSSSHAKMLLNGVEMNKLYDNKPYWANWSGVNDLIRNQQNTQSFMPNSNSFGAVLGTTNIIARASDYRAGTGFSYSNSNRTYQHRFMGSYKSGVLKNKWAYAVVLSGAFADKGYNDGTKYNATGFMSVVEKKFNSSHSLNLVTIASSQKRGKSSANTKEVTDLKGLRYNSYWGPQGIKTRNSRIKTVFEPIFLLNHFWDINSKLKINTNFLYQFGNRSDSRLSYNGTRLLSDGTIIGGGFSPDPTYYKKLPSYSLKNNAIDTYEVLQEFKKNGQLQWNTLYKQNLEGVGNSKYILYDDCIDDNTVTLNSIINYKFNDNICFSGVISYQGLTSSNYAQIKDLLGGKYYLDVDMYSKDEKLRQSDLNTPNRKVKAGDQFLYNYDINTSQVNSFFQSEFTYKTFEYYLATSLKSRNYYRNGFYKNGIYPLHSFGKSKSLVSTAFGLKTGLVYKGLGRHLIQSNLAYIEKLPTLRQVFSNPRQHNYYTEGLEKPKDLSFDVSYLVRLPKFRSKVTGFYFRSFDDIQNSYFYADGINGDYSTFAQQTVTDISTKHVGVNLGLSYTLTPKININSAINYGNYTYADDAKLQLTSDASNFIFEKQKVFLKNYKVASGPQKAMSLGIRYNSPDYWWFNASINYLSDSYINISKLKRTVNFITDTDKIPFTDFDKSLARKLLTQERFSDYQITNLSFGTSWRLPNNTYLGLILSVQNLFNKHFITGGFEQTRTANYRTLKEDMSLEKPVFGNKYWYGRGGNYFLHLYYRI